jgi:hypothetical protein
MLAVLNIDAVPNLERLAQALEVLFKIRKVNKTVHRSTIKVAFRHVSYLLVKSV